jgi:hypothetical protein
MSRWNVEYLRLCCNLYRNGTTKKRGDGHERVHENLSNVCRNNSAVISTVMEPLKSEEMVMNGFTKI